jgi:hypothetical protein
MLKVCVHISILDEAIRFFQLTRSFHPLYGPGVDSASNRNEYKKIFLRGKGRLTQSSLMSDGCSVGIVPSRTQATEFRFLCGLVVRVPGYRSRGPGSIPFATRFSEK